MRRRLFPTLAAGVLVSVLAGCGGSSSASKGPATTNPPNTGAVVELKNIAFNPEKVTITAGQAVVWKFDDGSIAHNVTGDGFRSTDRSSGTYTHTFTKPGDYKYTCTIHTGMDGEVVVN